ncbi:MAG: hypothetical protein H7257_03090 [Taibaiella sp.]|nr:hypothetical protein [Taibaiella sp.]
MSYQDTNERDIIDTIADNICLQLVEFQNHIAAREPGMCFPDAKEVETMRKLITCLEKLKKIAAPVTPEKGPKEHSNFDDSTTHKQTSKAVSIIPPAANSYMNLAQPVTPEDFEVYGNLVWEWTPACSPTTNFKGENVSSEWLQYNLYQLLLVPENRVFLNYKDYQRHICYDDTAIAIYRHEAEFGRSYSTLAA